MTGATFELKIRRNWTRTYITVFHELRSWAQSSYAYLSWKSDCWFQSETGEGIPRNGCTLDRCGFSCTSVAGRDE